MDQVAPSSAGVEPDAEPLESVVEDDLLVEEISIEPDAEPLESVVEDELLVEEISIDGMCGVY